MSLYDPHKSHYVVVTGVIVRDDKYLITRRSPNEKAFPSLWTVPGGKLEASDYQSRPKDTADHWYNVLEDVLQREVAEETNIEIKNIGYITSLVYIRDDGIPTLIVSLSADYAGGEIALCPALTEYAWVTLSEAKNYSLIEGIYEELEILDHLRQTNTATTWKKPDSSLDNR